MSRSIAGLVRTWRKVDLRAVLLLAPALCVAPAYSAGLGQLRVQSSLGKPLHANLPLVGSDIGHIVGACIKTKLVSLDGALIAVPRAHLADAPQAAAIVLSTAKSINEPAATLTVEIACGAGIRRDYQILLDPPVLAAVDVQEPAPASMPARLHAWEAGGI